MLFTGQQENTLSNVNSDKGVIAGNTVADQKVWSKPRRVENVFK